MDTIEIDKRITVPGFLGAFAYDALPPRQDGDFSLVINTEVASKPGAHWIALVKKGKLMYFLDSYGRNVKHFTFPTGFKETILKNIFLYIRNKTNFLVYLYYLFFICIFV